MLLFPNCNWWHYMDISRRTVITWHYIVTNVPFEQCSSMRTNNSSARKPPKYTYVPFIRLDFLHYTWLAVSVLSYNTRRFNIHH